MDQNTAFCEHCNAHRLVTRPKANHVLHLLLTLLTAGFWSPIWILCAIAPGPYRCPTCGGVCETNEQMLTRDIAIGIGSAVMLVIGAYAVARAAGLL